MRLLWDMARDFRRLEEEDCPFSATFCRPPELYWLAARIDRKATSDAQMLIGHEYPLKRRQPRDNRIVNGGTSVGWRPKWPDQWDAGSSCTVCPDVDRTSEIFDRKSVRGDTKLRSTAWHRACPHLR